MRNLILVNSLSHSGSTVLSMLLSGHEQLIALGEIFQVIRDEPSRWLEDPDRVCSCGAEASECPLWGKALRNIVGNAELGGAGKYESLDKKYQVVLDVFAELYGNSRIAVDTSKGFRSLQTVTDAPNLDVQIIYLIRDARAYAVSQMRSARKQRRKGLKKLKQTATFQLFKWYHGNKKRQKYIRKNKLKALTISYEELCFRSEEVLRNIFQELGVEHIEKMKDLNETDHHILVGNRMRLDSQLTLSYDDKWLSDSSWGVPYAIFRNVRRYNQRNVLSLCSDSYGLLDK